MANPASILKPLNPILNRGNDLTSFLSSDSSFYEGGGSKTIDTANNKNSAITGATWVKDIFGNCLNFVAASSQLVTTNFVFNMAALANFSIVVLAKINATAPAATMSLFGAYGSTTEITGQITSAWKVIFYTDGTGSGHSTNSNQSTAVLNDGRWHHYVFVQNSSGGKVQVYLDGLLVSNVNNTTDTAINPTNGMTIGCESDGVTPVNFFDGRIAYVGIYANRALQATEAWSLYTNSWQIYNKNKIVTSII